MATNSEQRQLEIIVNGQQANASIKEMAAAQAVLNAQITKMAADDPRRKELEQQYAKITQRVSEARATMRTYVQTEEELREAAEKLNRENAEIIVNGQKVSASMNEMRSAAGVLERQLNDLAKDDPGRAKMLADYRALKERIEDVSKEMGQVEESKSVFQQALGFAGVTVGAEAVIDIVKEIGGEVIDATKEFVKLRAEVHGLTGAVGPELDELTAGVASIASTFGKENSEVLQAANTLSKQMGVSQQEALKLIEQGFIAGADASGEFLDQVKEYPAQFKAAGLSASEAIGVISQSVTTGVFSDKGADVVKEFGLRIREQTPATHEALERAFGTEFTDTLFKGVKDGTITTVDALKRVATQMDENKIPANQLQTVIADVFGGPGEDAGLDYLKSLKNVGAGVEDLINTTDPYIQQQQALLDSNKELASAQNDLAKEFEGGSNIMTTLSNQAMTFLFSLLTSLVGVFKELWKPVRDIWSSLVDLGESLGLVSTKGASAKSAGEALGGVIRALLTPTIAFWKGLAEVVKHVVEWAKQSDVAKMVLLALTANIRLLWEVLSNAPAYFAGFSAAAEAAFTRVGRGIKAALTGDFEGAKAAFSGFGAEVAGEFKRAFDAAMAGGTAVVSAEATVQAGGADPDQRDSGGDGMTSAERQKAAEKAQKERERLRKQAQLADQKAAQARLDATKEWVKGLEALEDARIAAIPDRHQREIAQINMNARRKEAILTGSEEEIKLATVAIEEERVRLLQELNDKYLKEGEAKTKEQLAKRLADEDAAEVEREAKIQADFEKALISDATRDDLLYQAKHASLEAKLALEEAYAGKSSEQYRKTFKDLEKLETDHNKKVIEDTKKREEAKIAMLQFGLKSASSALQTTIDILGRDEAARKKNAAMIRAFSVGKIIVDGYEEIAAIWKNANSNPINILLPGAGTAMAVVQTALAVARTGLALNQVKSQQFAAGGWTGGGMQAPVNMRSGTVVSPLGQMLELSGMSVGSNGKLTDSTGFAVAGVVHEDEYVIPKWMRQDPQVMAIESWLEARRLRGYVTGGPTTDAGAQGPGLATPGLAAPGLDPQVVQQLVDVLGRIDGRLQGVEQWQRELQVQLALLPLEQQLEAIKQVRQESGITTS